MSDFYSSAVGASNSTTANCSSSRWLTEEVFKLIDLVQRDEAIYNPRHKYYFCRPYVENFWREVDLKLEKNPGASLAKWTNLRISFRREYTNYLEEKVPPCWSYFDRMFFLHPYLRKKHQQPKSLDAQMQYAMTRSFTNRLQRERDADAIGVAASSSTLTSTAVGGNGAAAAGVARVSTHTRVLNPLDNYLDYYEDAEPNASELDDMLEEEQQSSRFPHHHHEIKSECDVDDDYDAAARQNDFDDEPEADPEVDPADADEPYLRRIVLDSLASMAHEKRQHMRLQHLQRLQTRSYHDDLRSKRPRSQESISSTQALANGPMAPVAPAATTTNPTTTPATAHLNVSFVRPTFAKPPPPPPPSLPALATTASTQLSAMDMVSTTTSSLNYLANDREQIASVASSSATAAVNTLTTTQQRHQQHHHHLQHAHHHHHHNRLEFSSAAGAAGTSTAGTTTASQAAAAPAHLDLCDCKTDPDAMFLMSLLPDIQKLNGRDRGKIKIAFQNILQDYLYPD